MAETPTPGETAYTAFWQVQRTDGHYHWPPPFAKLPALTRQAWEAAGQAAVAHADRQRALACEVYEAVWRQIARCECDTAHRVPVGELCASCESLKSLADAAQQETQQ